MRLTLATWDRDRFTQARAAKGWTLGQLAARADLGTDAVSAYSHGRATPSPHALVTLAAVLEVPTTFLAPLQDPPRLHELRWHAGCSVADFADRIGESHTRVGAAFRGEAKIANPARWAEGFGVDEDTVRRAWDATRSDLKSRP